MFEEMEDVQKFSAFNGRNSAVELDEDLLRVKAPLFMLQNGRHLDGINNRLWLPSLPLSGQRIDAVVCSSVDKVVPHPTASN